MRETIDILGVRHDAVWSARQAGIAKKLDGVASQIPLGQHAMQGCVFC